MFECSVCGRGPSRDGTSTYRNGERGKTGVPWRCMEHLDPEYATQDLLQIVAMLEQQQLQPTVH